ncbi:MAG: outer membrane protein assembly factor BamD [Microscillaceae bacterium]|nr:outer membrane protein assembly factor BamD [Microscillaceae bacterium]MDW8461387.1 outer membrane protein assembly factor BamD [Cytophagales bacterium]
MSFYKRLILLAFTILFLGSCSKFNRIVKSDDLQKKYDAAINYYHQKSYYKAGILLEELLPLITGQKEQEIAQFYYGYCHYYQRQLSLGAFYFNKFYQNFRASQYAEEALYMYARCMYEDTPEYNLDQTNTTSAIAAAQNFLNVYPQSKYAADCNKFIKDLREKLERKAYENAKLYYKIGYLHAAVIAFGNFKNSFPDSDYNEECAFLKLQAQYDYARLSTERKQKERYNEAINFYLNFIDTYPNSKYLKQAEKIYNSALSKINNLK